MELQRFFDHWNLKEHPFQAEEARNDSVYNRMLEGAITHPDFAKIYGDPANPSTTIVFGEKGSGKTAMRLMIQNRIEQYNAECGDGKAFLVYHDDLNPTLDRLARHLKVSDPMKTLAAVTLADHQDAILSEAVTRVIDEALASIDQAKRKKLRKSLRRMDRQKRMDLATLALLYDQPRSGETADRWNRLRRILRVGTSWNKGAHSAMTITLGVIALVGVVGWYFFDPESWEMIALAVLGGLGFIAVGFWKLLRAWRNSRLGRRLVKEVRVVEHPPQAITARLWDLRESSVQAQPLPSKGDQDTRYDLTSRLLSILNELGYSSLVVLVDRIDEPMMVNGEAERMKLILWPMMNNKFLQQQRIGIKMLIPIEMSQMLAGESSDFRRQARLDKQNVVNPLKWTGVTLYDLCSWRFSNCQKDAAEKRPLEDLFSDDVNHDELVEALDQMHQPRDAFKFLYAVIAEYCNNTPSETDQFTIPKATLDFVRRAQSQRLVDLYRGSGTA